MGDDEETTRDVLESLAQHHPHARVTVLKLFPQPSIPNAREHLLAQDLVLVEGGSVVNLMAVWRAHGLDSVLRECWEAGVVLAGTSAGSLCWHVGGPTDSFSDELDCWSGGMALLPFSNGVHDDAPDQPRRTTYRAAVARRELPAGYATEDGVGLHYVGTELHEAVSVRAGATAWWVAAGGDGEHVEERVGTRYLGA
jgi:peptidase E